MKRRITKIITNLKYLIVKGMTIWTLSLIIFTRDRKGIKRKRTGYLFFKEK